MRSGEAITYGQSLAAARCKNQLRCVNFPDGKRAASRLRQSKAEEAAAAHLLSAPDLGIAEACAFWMIGQHTADSFAHLFKESAYLAEWSHLRAHALENACGRRIPQWFENGTRGPFRWNNIRPIVNHMAHELTGVRVRVDGIISKFPTAELARRTSLAKEKPR